MGERRRANLGRKTALQDVIAKFICTKVLVNRGSFGWAVEYRPLEVNDVTLVTMLNGKEPKHSMPIKGGPLVNRVPKASAVASSQSAA